MTKHESTLNENKQNYPFQQQRDATTSCCESAG